MTRVVLLFLHGGSYTKECWGPIIRRLRASPLLQRSRARVEFAAFDWRFHGEKSDHSVPGTLSFVRGDKKKPRADHPLRVWVGWGLDDLRQEIQKLRAAEADTKIVAIGHSMGASAMLQVEVEDPGTFEAIIAFEPVHGKTEQEADAVTDMLVAITLRRPSAWASWGDVVEHFKTGKMYRRWNAESMDAFLQQGVRKMEDGTFALATLPLQEAAIYCHSMLQIDFGRVRCPVTFEHAEKSYFFDAAATRQVTLTYPDKYAMGDAIPNTTHSMVVEDPATCATHILENLAKLPLFHPAPQL